MTDAPPPDAPVFLGFLYHLRDYGLRVTTTEWLALMRALVLGHARSSLSVFYYLARAILVNRETDFDRYDQAFASFFEGLENHFTLDDEVLKWLENPVLPRDLTPDELAMLEAMDLETLREQFEQRLREQDERHDGGNRWVGTGGTSPFGQGGTNPAGVRVGGSGGGRSAVQVAVARRYRNLRSDRVLDTRQLGAALRRLRHLAKDERTVELNLDATIDETARQGGEIELVFSPPRANRVKLLLLMDVGGSMDPHAELCERLFSAAHAATHFKAFKPYYFHNCVYDYVWKDAEQDDRIPTDEILGMLDATWTVIFVGDAWMHPFELTQSGGAIDYSTLNRRPGVGWLEEIRRRAPNSVWLNPENPRVWEAPSVRIVRGVFPMFALTLEGLTEAVDMLRGHRANIATVPPFANPFV